MKPICEAQMCDYVTVGFSDEIAVLKFQTCLVLYGRFYYKLQSKPEENLTTTH